MKQMAWGWAVLCGMALCVGLPGGVQAKEFSKDGPVTTDRTVTWPVPWQQGRRLEYDEVNETVVIHDSSESRSTSTSIAAVEIIEAGGDGYLQRWTWREGQTRDEGVDETVRRAAAAMVKGMEDLPLDVRLDRDGAYVAVANIGDLSRKARTGVHRATEALFAEAKRPLSKAEQKGMLRMLDMLTTPVALENLVATLASRYNFVSGGGLAPGKEYAYDDEGPNPFGGAPFPMRNTMLLEPDAQDGWYLVQWTMVMDREKGSAVLADAVTRLLQRSGGKVPTAELDAARAKVLEDTDVNFSARYRVDAATGIVQWMQLVQAKRVGGRNTVQTSTLTLRH
ncbi:hypothetical protein [Lysobacter solisilvae (ex Woo and Kim 2020)]|uniref:Lipoprotein n=1 Tax=Agrilutibacter terrestris TaxID=2865112 RepID=A0A7H0FUM7_9GAMM|nr:hypothetical protein [Lysobacter terrestris]QNP39743.1 hypothetical protein H8B22_09480 [Lysobacter terrestris]